MQSLDLLLGFSGFFNALIRSSVLSIPEKGFYPKPRVGLGKSPQSLRCDTLRMIDGAGPNVEAPPSESATQERVNGMEAQRVSSRGDLPEKETQARTARPEMVEQASSAQNAPATSRDAVGDSARPAKATMREPFPEEPLEDGFVTRVGL